MLFEQVNFAPSALCPSHLVESGHVHSAGREGEQPAGAVDQTADLKARAPPALGQTGGFSRTHHVAATSLHAEHTHHRHVVVTHWISV